MARRQKDNLIKSKPGIRFRLFNFPMWRNLSVQVDIQQELKEKFSKYKYGELSRKLREKELNIFSIKDEEDLFKKFPDLKKLFENFLDKVHQKLFETAVNKKILDKNNYKNWYPNIYGAYIEELREEKK